MNQKHEKLKTLLKELFQLDQPDLDFGLYRVMHAKSAEVSKFLDEDLLPQVKAAFGLYRTADKAEIEKELGKVIADIEAAEMNPNDSPKVKELRARLRSDAVDIGTLESEVYDHLFSFFRRYYSEGDFLAKRVYKPGVYAIPYEGEEVTLHWANKDQYYIKTSEYLRDYAFRLRPDDENKPMRVHFRLADAAEGEHGNVKAAAGKNRLFILSAPGDSGYDFLAEEDGEQGKELVICFEYRPATRTDWSDEKRSVKTTPPSQKDLVALAVTQILAATGAAWAEWIVELGKSHVMACGDQADYSRLEAHIRRYTARNTFDYFIHKDLGIFLRQELDFYIKNEVMHLDDVENESAPRVEQYLSKITVIRKIAGKVIAFLAQLEDFQKKLWLKKRFVVETQYCITVGRIPEEFYAEIAENQAQYDEWVALLAVDAIEGDLIAPSYSKKLKSDFLKENPTLVVDTRYFDSGFTERLLEAIGEVDEQIDGVLFNSENLQSLSLMRARYQEQCEVIYIDPPYNTEFDREQGNFLYKDSYPHSTWAALMFDRLDAGHAVLHPTGTFICSIDDNEQTTLRLLMNTLFGNTNFINSIAWKSRDSVSSDHKVSLNHNYHVLYAKDLKANTFGGFPIDASEYSNPDSDARGPWKPVPIDANKPGGDTQYPIKNPNTGENFYPPNGRSWAFNSTTYRSLLADQRIVFGMKGTAAPKRKLFLRERMAKGDVKTAISIWADTETTQTGTTQLMDLFGSKVFSYPKPVGLMRDLLRISYLQTNILIADYFAGSGSTSHAVIDLNREDGGRRKFVLVEMGDHFDRVLLPRIKKVTFTPEWEGGKPKRLVTPEEAERSPRIVKVLRLESYEDTLNNLKTETRRNDMQQLLLDDTDAQGADGFKEQYILRYMLDVETRDSQSLLNVLAFADPTAYKLKVKRPGSDESRRVNVDLLETFNWLVGLTVRHIAAPQSFSAAFERDDERRLRLKGRLKQSEDGGPYWFRTVTGTTPDGRRTLVIWRKLPGEPEQDNLVLDEWFTRHGYSAKDSEFDLIYVNGGNNLENLKTPDDLWKVRLIEDDFHRLMFEMEEA